MTNHTPEKDTVTLENGTTIMAECLDCGETIYATEIDNKMLNDTGELVVLNWREIGK